MDIFSFIGTKSNRFSVCSVCFTISGLTFSDGI